MIKEPTLIDTNLLYEYLDIKLKNSTNISKKEKFLIKLLEEKVSIVVTPHVLAELSNLANRDDYQFETFFNKLVNLGFIEKNIDYQDVLACKAIKFGFTDAALAALCKKLKMRLITNERDLSGWCESKSLNVARFEMLYYVKGAL